MVFGLALAARGFSTHQVSGEGLGGENSGQEAGRRVCDSVRAGGRREERHHPTREVLCVQWLLNPSVAPEEAESGARLGLSGRPLFSRAPKYIQQGLPARVPRMSGKP